MAKRVMLLACVGQALLIAGATCTLLAPPVEGPDGLADLEKAVIGAARLAAGAFGQAVGTSRHAAGEQEAAAEVQPGELTVGTCPEVTTSATLGDAGLDVSIDFQDGCTLPIGGDYTCSGSASGQIDLLGRTLVLEFDGISCSDQTTLSGSVNLGYSLSGGSVDLQGQWDLTYTDDGEQIVTTGTGVAHYDTNTLATEIAEFQGSLTEGDDQWQMSVSDVAISYAAQQSYLPYAGTVTLSGPAIRQLTIRFNENSPSTGDVEISVAGGPFFTVNLYEL